MSKGFDDRVDYRIASGDTLVTIASDFVSFDPYSHPTIPTVTHRMRMFNRAAIDKIAEVVREGRRFRIVEAHAPPFARFATAYLEEIP